MGRYFKVPWSFFLLSVLLTILLVVFNPLFSSGHLLLASDNISQVVPPSANVTKPLPPSDNISQPFAPGDNTTPTKGVDGGQSGGGMLLSYSSETLRPNAAGDKTDCTPNSGSNWACVDEDPSDNASSYVRATSPSSYTEDLYNLPAHSGNGTIAKVTVYVRACTDTTVTQASVYAKIKTHGSEYNGNAITLIYPPLTWKTYCYEWNTNPYTGSAWTWDEINDLQIGVGLRSPTSGVQNTSYCTQVYAVVEYAPIVLNTLILRPNAAGDKTNCIPSSGNNSDCVDEDPPDDSSSWVGGYYQGDNYKEDLYNINNTTTDNGTITSVSVYARVATDTTADQVSVKVGLKSGGTEDWAGTMALPSGPPVTWIYDVVTWPTNPDTGENWTWSAINALQIGVALKSPTYQQSNWSYCTQVYAVVTYQGTHRSWGTHIKDDTQDVIKGVSANHTFFDDYIPPPFGRTLYAPTIIGPKSPLEVSSAYLYQSENLIRCIQIWDHVVGHSVCWVTSANWSDYLVSNTYYTQIYRDTTIQPNAWVAKLRNVTQGRWDTLAIQTTNRPDPDGAGSDNNSYGWDVFEEYNYPESPWPSLGKTFEAKDIKVWDTSIPDWVDCTGTYSDNTTYFDPFPYQKVYVSDFYRWYVTD